CLLRCSPSFPYTTLFRSRKFKLRCSDAMALRWVPLLLGAITFTSGTAGAQDIVPRIEVGPQVTQLYVPARTVGSVTYQPAVGARSEEHTSELQSPDHLVC